MAKDTTVSGNRATIPGQQTIPGQTARIQAPVERKVEVQRQPETEAPDHVPSRQGLEPVALEQTKSPTAFLQAREEHAATKSQAEQPRVHRGRTSELRVLSPDKVRASMSVPARRFFRAVHDRPEVIEYRQAVKARGES